LHAGEWVWKRHRRLGSPGVSAVWLTLKAWVWGGVQWVHYPGLEVGHRPQMVLLGREVPEAPAWRLVRVEPVVSPRPTSVDLDEHPRQASVCVSSSSQLGDWNWGGEQCLQPLGYPLPHLSVNAWVRSSVYGMREVWRQMEGVRFSCAFAVAQYAQLRRLCPPLGEGASGMLCQGPPLRRDLPLLHV
jgi:hypothetical protein